MNSSVMPHEFVTSEKITIDYLNYADSIKQVFPKHFKKPTIRKLSMDRQEITDKLLDYNHRINAPEQVIENIESLSQPETYVVMTGQQPGIFSGPLYTVYKAISAIVLCARLSNRKHSFIPVFWNASEDHDLSEVNHITIFKQNKPFKIQYDCESTDVAYSHLHLDKIQLKKILAMIKNVSPNSEFKEPLLNEINQTIQTSSNIGDFFSRFMIHLFGDLGLVLIEPQQLRELMTPVFEKLIRKPTECTQILIETNLQLDKLGYSPKIHKKPDLCNFFILNDKGERSRVKYDGKFRVANETFSQKELLRLLNDNPFRFSANAVTRPVTQDFLFPTFAYVAGPNEIAYYAQLKEIYTFFSVDMPVIFPRFGATIIEKKTSKVLRKCKAKIYEFKDPEKLLKKLAKENIADVFNSVKNEVSKSMDRVTEEAVSIDKNLIGSCSLAKGKMLKTVEVLEDKITSELKKQDLIARRQIIKVYNNVFPYGDLQERQINVLEYLMKFGEKFLEIVHEDFFEAEYGEHRVIRC